MPNPTSKIPEPCPDCGSYHTEAEHDAFDAAQKELHRQMIEVMDMHGHVFDEMVARLSLATGRDNFDKTVIVAFLAHYLMSQLDVPEQTFNRCLDALIDAAEDNPWIKMVAGKKPADA